jgi:hypothetical protein
MAYRFLLEAPESLADTASVAVERVDDAQVLVVRPSHGLGVDDPQVDITVAAHSLRVIDSLYDWFDSLGASRPDLRIVLHGGERHSLEEVDRGRMVALIRRDQPWVDRSIPHVGDHEPSEELAGYSVGAGVPAEAPSLVAVGSRAAAVMAERGTSVVAAEELEGPRIRAINYILVQVNDLAKAERFYSEYFAMELLGRVKLASDGTMTPLPHDYTWERAMETGDLADVTFLSNGPLTLAAQRMGLGVLLGLGAVDVISVGVDSRTFATLKGEALMRPLTVLRSGVASFMIRDPFNVTWEIAVIGSVPLIPV